MSRDHVVLDASALLALLNAEPGQEQVIERLSRAVIGAVNLAEVIGKLVDAGVPEDDARAVIAEIGLPVIGLDEDQACTTGALRAHTRTLGLSLGDRACLALGLKLGAPILTADRAWVELDLDLEILQIRGDA